MGVLVALVITFCSNVHYDNPSKEKQCVSKFEECRKRQVWRFVEHFNYDANLERLVFLECHERMEHSSSIYDDISLNVSSKASRKIYEN